MSNLMYSIEVNHSEYGISYKFIGIDSREYKERILCDLLRIAQSEGDMLPAIQKIADSDKICQ